MGRLPILTCERGNAGRGGRIAHGRSAIGHNFRQSPADGRKEPSGISGGEPAYRGYHPAPGRPMSVRSFFASIRILVICVLVVSCTVACGGPAFVSNSSVDAGGSNDATEDLPPIICKHCDDTPGATDASDGSADVRDAPSTNDSTVASDASGAAVGSGEGDSASDGRALEAGGDAIGRDTGSDAPAQDTGPDAGSCATGDLSCDGGCISSDVRHCGACGNDCTNLPFVSGTVTCAAGQCSFPPSSCAPNRADCNGNPADGCETDLTQTSHCGSCAMTCTAAAPLCAATTDGGSSCATGCPAATPVLCSGTCVDTSSSIANCGACATPCTTSIAHAQPSCSGGTCAFTCNSGYTQCNGACVDERTDPSNCGGCGAGHACAGGTTCQNGSCQCPAGTHDCGGTCESNTSLNSCGALCNVACPGPSNGSSFGQAICDGNSCGIACNQGYTLCGNACVDEQSDSNHCGSCGKACGSGLACVSGACACTTTSCPGCCNGSQCLVKPTFYQDADGDGYGNAAVPISACIRPNGYVSDNTDCCDSDANAHPGSTYCSSSKRACGDNWDYNCDGASGAVTCSADPGTVTNGPMDCQNQGETISCAFDANNSCTGTCSGSSTPNPSCAGACDWVISTSCGNLPGYEHLFCVITGPGCTSSSTGSGPAPAQACN